MFDFNETRICKKCGSDNSGLFVNEKGQGIRCKDCLHEKIVVEPQKKSHKKRLKVRMKEAWDNQKKSKSKEF